MKFYTVILTRDITESAAVTVSAKDEEEAEDLALACSETLRFIPDDNFHRDDDIYVTDISEADNV